MAIHTECQRQLALMAELLQQIAYPKRGTAEQAMDIYQAAEAIQKQFTLNELENMKTINTDN